jgi:hypothetical protein
MLAYIHETVQPKDVGGISTAGYRIGIFLVTVLSLYAYENFSVSWSLMFQIYSIIMTLLNALILVMPREAVYVNRSFNQTFIMPYKDLIKEYGGELILIVVFMVLFKMSDRFISPLESMFLRSNFTSKEFLFLKFVSTFALTFAAVKSSALLKRVGFRKSFLISILGNIFLILSYFLCTLQNTYSYLSSLVISCFVFLNLYILNNSKAPNFKNIASTALVLAIAIYFKVSLQTIAIFATVIAAKMISGIRASTLYSYEFALASPKHSLAQMTIITCMEQVVNSVIGSYSGHQVDRFGWTGFYMIAFGMSFLPDRKSVV